MISRAVSGHSGFMWSRALRPEISVSYHFILNIKQKLFHTTLIFACQNLWQPLTWADTETDPLWVHQGPRIWICPAEEAVSPECIVQRWPGFRTQGSDTLLKFRRKFKVEPRLRKTNRQFVGKFGADCADFIFSCGCIWTTEVNGA